ncbi:MAG: GNAT family N-acetyltransferase [Oscillospiraceae bacterium]|nr:GNAT family N-acetyltransferase [Oscillospiraceae bacterium]
MTITLDDRTERTVRIYYELSQQPVIKAMLPQKAQSVEEAVCDYKKTLLPKSTSFGRVIRVDGEYVGDVWSYCIDKAETPNAMLSYCVFDRAYWGKGVASTAVSLFLKELRERYPIGSLGAFTFSENIASQRVLAKNGFLLVEEFVEDGKPSRYYQLDF